jgi:hypothetical protein
LNVPEPIEELCKVQDLAFSTEALVMAGVLGTEVLSEDVLVLLQAVAIKSRKIEKKVKKDTFFIRNKKCGRCVNTYIWEYIKYAPWAE